MEQVIKILNEAFLPENLECDGPRICMGCWKDKVMQAIKLLQEIDINSMNGLIAKQQIEIESYKKMSQKNEEILKDLHGAAYSIGAPLNDNKLRFNAQQIAWCLELYSEIKQIQTQIE